MDCDVLNPPSPLRTRLNRKDVTRPVPTLRSLRWYYRVDRCDISLLRFILEAYEGAATVTTIGPADGAVVITVAPGWELLVEDLLADLADRKVIRIERLTTPSSAERSLA